MDVTPSQQAPATVRCHVVAVPYPGRGHINPMMSLCKLIASKTHGNILITIVVTEEWLGIIGSDPKPDSIRFASIPNVIPSEQVRGLEFPEFYEAVKTKMDAPVEQLLDQLQPAVTNILSDLELLWAIRIGKSINIPVAMLCTTSATYFMKLQYFSQIKDRDLLLDLLEQPDETSNIPEGISPSQVAELRNIYCINVRRNIELSLESHSWVPKSQCLLFSSVHELEPQAFNTLTTKFSFPLYPIGPVVPYLDSQPITPELEWLDSQPRASVLYVSLGSFISVSSEQMDEILAGLQSSGVKYLWVTRGESSTLRNKSSSGGGMHGLVVPWCNQLKVLCHSSVGGFLTHCGWNSTLEGIIAGVAMLTYPISYDQFSNGEQIVEGWRIGMRGRGRVVGDDQRLVSRDEIAENVKEFMDEESIEVQNMRKRVGEFREICYKARAEGGSSQKNLDAFIRDISRGHFRF